jgi:hypothetical protein
MRKDDVTTGAALYFLINKLDKCIGMLGKTPGIGTDLGFFYEAISVKPAYMSEPQGCCITALPVSILISVTTISLNECSYLRNLSEVHVIATSRIHYSNDLAIYK